MWVQCYWVNNIYWIRCLKQKHTQNRVVNWLVDRKQAHRNLNLPVFPRGAMVLSLIIQVSLQTITAVNNENQLHVVTLDKIHCFMMITRQAVGKTWFQNLAVLLTSYDTLRSHSPLAGISFLLVGWEWPLGVPFPLCLKLRSLSLPWRSRPSVEGSSRWQWQLPSCVWDRLTSLLRTQVTITGGNLSWGFFDGEGGGHCTPQWNPSPSSCHLLVRTIRQYEDVLRCKEPSQ